MSFALLVAVLLERCVHERPEGAVEVVAVDGGELAAGHGHRALGQVLVDVAVLLERVVVSDDADAVAGVDLAVGLELVDAALGFIAERLGVVGELVLVPQHARCEPQVADRHVVEQALEAADVVVVQVRRAERGQVGLPIALGQRVDELVDDRHARVVVALGVGDVVDVDLHDGVLVDDDRDAVAAADGREDDAAIWKGQSHGGETSL